MTTFAFEPPPQVSLPIVGSHARFPVRHVHCVGRNYREHVREMGGDPARGTPIFFGKPRDSVVLPGESVPYPLATRELHHEVELVAAIGSHGLFAYGVGVDLTRRDLQQAARAAGAPWAMSKGFDASAPCSELRPLDAPPTAGLIELSVNREVRQRGDLAQMIWSVDEIVAALAELVAVCPGDLIFCGTPEGVGPLVVGDRVNGRIEGVGELTFEVVTR